MSRSGRADPQSVAQLDDDVRRDFGAFGFTIEEDTEEAEEDVFEVWADCWPALQIFLACETQWRHVAHRAGIDWTGLDYVALDVVMRRRNADDSIFDDIRVMEAEAINTFGELAE